MAALIDKILEIKTTEMHTGGEPVRIFEAHFPELKGLTLLEKRAKFKEKFDNIRKTLMHEPRGHLDMYGAALVEPDNPEANLGVLFMHNEGYSTMCGHAVIALSRYAVDKGLVIKTPPITNVKIQCPCGLVSAYVHHLSDNSKNTVDVSFHSVPSFLYERDIVVDVPKYGTITTDISYGGAFYAILPASELKLNLEDTSMNTIVQAATAVTIAVKEKLKFHHPVDKELAFLYGTIITDGQDEFSETPSTNICVFADKQVDRSPTGSGVTARIALQFAKGQIKLGQTRTFLSCIGTKFLGSPIKESKCGNKSAVIVEVSGRAYYTGECKFFIEKGDPLADGFILNR